MYIWGCTFILLHKYDKTKENESFLLHLNNHSNNVALCMKVHEGIGRQCRWCIVFGKNGKGFVPLPEGRDKMQSSDVDMLSGLQGKA